MKTADLPAPAYDSIEPLTPRTSWSASLWTLYTLTVRQHLRGRRWMVMGCLFLLPALLAVVLRLTTVDAASIELEFQLVFMFMPQALLPLVALVYASGIIQDEQEEQTLTYLLMRPIPRWAIYVVKLLASISMAAPLTMIFTALTYAAIYIGAGSGVEHIALRCMKAAAIHAAGVAAYCSLFGLIGMLTRHALIVGIIYAALIEGILANMPFSVRNFAVIYYTRLITYRSLPFLSGNDDIAAKYFQFDIRNDPSLAEHPSLRTCLLALTAASLACTLIAAILCARREFHVKTPEVGG